MLKSITGIGVTAFCFAVALMAPTAASADWVGGIQKEKPSGHAWGFWADAVSGPEEVVVNPKED